MVLGPKFRNLAIAIEFGMQNNTFESNFQILSF